MPEDYQAILDDLGVNTEPTNNPDGGNNTDPVQDPAPQDPSANPEQDPESTPQNPVQQPAQDDDTKKRNDAFAAMRSENSEYKKFIQHIMKGANYQGTEKDFMKTLTEASYKRQAQMQGNQVSPELLKRMDALESQNKSLIDSQNRQTFATNLKNLQETFALKDSELKEFLDLAVKEHIDLTIPGTNFITLYQGLFFDKLKEKTIEEERQKWIAQSNKANNAANPDDKSGKKDPTPTNVNTMAEFNSLLQSVPINKK